MEVFFTSQLQEALRLDLFLRRQGASTALIRSIKYRNPGLQINGFAAKTNAMVFYGDLVCAHLPEDDAALLLAAQDIDVEVLHASRHSFVANKPAGMAMHPVRAYKDKTLGNAFMGWLEKNNLPARAFRPVGRLDVGTSGLVLCAMNCFAAQPLFKSCKKRYLAVLEGVPQEKSGRIECPIGPCEHSVIKQQVCEKGRHAATSYNVIAGGRRRALAEVWLETGRTHQIRLHFSHIGHPLVGDSLYGVEDGEIKRQALHCAGLEFEEPGGGKLVFEAALPQDIVRILESI